MKFAIIAPALIAGAFVERLRFSAYVIFALLWTTLVYDPVAHWTRALSRKSPNSAHHTVLGAWRYVCLETQPEDSSSDANYSRSIYWPECAGDYIYGWGPQTEPDRDPFDEFAQAELLEDDQRAPQ
jgi:hypothetical protein